MKFPSPSRIVFRPKPLAMGLAIAAAAFVNSALAATSTWTGASDASWGTNGNWALTAPASLDTVLFGPTSTSNLGTTLSSDTSIAGLTVTSPSGAVSISANTLTLGSGGIDMSAATQNLTISSGLTLLDHAGQTWNVASGQTLTLDTGVFTRNAGATLNILGTGTIATTNIANTNGIVGAWASIGSGTSLSYASVSSGQIIALTGSPIFSNTTNSATTNFDMTGNVSLAAGSGSRAGNTIRSTAGAATMTLANNRHVQLTSGMMNAGTGTLTITRTGGAGQINPLSTDLTFVTNTQAFNISVPISNQNFGAGAATTITTSSPEGGTITLSGINTYTGGTTINSGILNAGASTTAGNYLGAGSVAVNGGKLTLNASGIGHLTGVTNFTMSSGSTAFNLASLASFDSIAGTGSFTLSGGTIILSGTLVGDVTDSYALFSGFSGNTVGSFAFDTSGLTNLGDRAATLSSEGVLTFAAVPEPSQWMLVLAGLLFVMIACRRARADTLSS